MTRRTRDLPERRRDERDRIIHRVSAAIDARRRLNARRAVGTGTKEDPFGPDDSRYAYLTRAHG